MWEKSLSRNCLEVKNDICFETALFPQNETYSGKCYCHHLSPNGFSSFSLSARARPRKWSKRVIAHSLYYFVYLLLFTRKGLPHFKYDMSSESTPPNIEQVERRFSKHFDKGPSHDYISAFPLHFDHDRDVDVKVGLELAILLPETERKFLLHHLFYFKFKRALISFYSDSCLYKLRVSQW